MSNIVKTALEKAQGAAMAVDGDASSSTRPTS